MESVATERLSRIDYEGYAKVPQYAASFWDEHRENFKAQLDQLLQDETVVKLIKSTKNTCLQWSAQKLKVDPQYNDSVIAKFYDKLVEAPDRKQLIFAGMDVYFSVLRTIPDTEKSVGLLAVFQKPESRKAMKAWTSTVIGEGYDEDLSARFFHPHLHMFCLLILDIYDRSLEGCTVEQFLKGPEGRIQQKKREMRDEASVKSFWEQFVSAKNVTSPPTPASASSSFAPSESFGNAADSAKSGKAPKGELVMLEAAIQKSHQELTALWNNNKTEFPEKWKAKTEIERKELVAHLRQKFQTLAGGAYELALFYCPEIHSGDLSKDSGQQFMKLLDISTAEDLRDIDAFGSHIAAHLKSEHKEKLLPSITLTRRFLLLNFCARLISKVLDIPFNEDSSV